jgi:hypothetical protein
VEKRGAKASLSAALMKKINQQVLASPVLHGVFDIRRAITNAIRRKYHYLILISNFLK